MAADLLSTELNDYLSGLLPSRPEEMLLMESYAVENDFPIIGPLSGCFCYQMARMVKARSIFELGSGYGYSTAWFAMAVKENGGGRVHHVVWDKELSLKAQKHLTVLGFEEIIEYHEAEAIEKLREMPGQFDLIFNDIDKRDYPESLPVIKEKLRSGGLLIIDNMLWGTRILDKSDSSPETEGVRKITQQITSDPDWITSLVPLRDGLGIALKR